MPYYHKLGKLPAKRHTQFRQEDGSLYSEELLSSIGFDGIYSNLYHIHVPTRVKKVLPSTPCKPKAVENYGLNNTHLKTAGLERTGKDFLDARKPLLINSDTVICVCNPSELTMDYYYRNGEADELIYVHDGAGVLLSQYGKVKFTKGDYIVVPRTTIFKMEFDAEIAPRLLITESQMPIETVGRYRNQMGQLLEHSPYCERDIHPPSELAIDKNDGETLIKTRKGGFIHQHLYHHSPLDVVGWDGCLYPYTFSIYDFEPITGRIHLPPPIHQTFQARGAFVICSFVPRMFDYHPQSIPTPYNHSNIDSDEVLFYAEGEFMSRKGIDRGSFTLHPGGIPHGPHPGTVEKSLGKASTDEYAVMIDTFKPLFLTQEAMEFVDKDYPLSWG